jgi:hypothetical protein
MYTNLSPCTVHPSSTCTRQPQTPPPSIHKLHWITAGAPATPLPHTAAKVATPYPPHRHKSAYRTRHIGLIAERPSSPCLRPQLYELHKPLRQPGRHIHRGARSPSNRQHHIIRRHARYCHERVVPGVCVWVLPVWGGRGAGGRFRCKPCLGACARRRCGGVMNAAAYPHTKQIHTKTHHSWIGRLSTTAERRLATNTRRIRRPHDTRDAHSSLTWACAGVHTHVTHVIHRFSRDGGVCMCCGGYTQA